MSAPGAGERGGEDLGALGCTRDGYQLIGVGFLASGLSGTLTMLGVHASFSFRPESWSASLYRGLQDVLSLAGLALVVIGLSAHAVAPHGPFVRWLKRLVVAFALLMLVWQLLQHVPRPEDHPWLTWIKNAIERYVLRHGDLRYIALCLGSAIFCGRRAWTGQALLWGALFAFQLVARFYWSALRPWMVLQGVGFYVAPFWTAWSLGRYIRGASKQIA